MGVDYVDYEKQGVQILGIRFAPLCVPWQRRWETFCFGLYFFTSAGLIPLMPLIIPLLVYLLIYSQLRYLIILYTCWVIYDLNTPFTGGTRKWWLRRLLPAARKYFPAELVKTEDLPANTNYLFGVAPHGIICHGVIANFALDVRFRELFPGLDCHVISLTTFFWLPLIREVFLQSGISASNKENIMYHLNSKQKNNVVCLVMGGAAESLLSSPGTNIVVIDNRKGFIKLALQSGSSLVPVYTFGENEVMTQFQGKYITQFQNFSRKYLGIPPMLIRGRGFFQYTFGLLAHRRPLTSVVGKPIPVPKIENPTQSEVDEYHKKFKEGLIELFEANKEKYDPNGKNAQLICL